MSINAAPIVRAFMTHEMRDADIAALATGRAEEFERILDAIQRSRRAAPGTLQHVVLYGSRGFGKSFMTRRVQIATAGMAGKTGPVHYVLLAEEQHNLQRNPHAFLDLISAYLKQSRGHMGDADTAFRDTMFQWPKPGEEGRRWDAAAARLEAEIDATLDCGKGLIIAVVENFDSLLATLFKDEEDEQRLRQWLDRTGNRLMLFATATGTVDIHYDRPLFQAFESVRLSPWSSDDSIEYFNRLRRLENRPSLSAGEEAKARAIAEFIGGTPRLAQLLSEVIDTQEALTVADTMSALADRLAEYYRRRIDDLPQLAKGLLDALIRGGEPASQTALAERVGAGGQNIIARTMADLERADIIRGRRAPDSREKLYSVTDRVFVHYYRLRQGSVVARETPLATILDFLRSFYSREEQLDQALKHLEAGRPAEAGLFSRLATEGVTRPQNEYLSGFATRLELYAEGLSRGEISPIIHLEGLLKKEPEESYHQCGESGSETPKLTSLFGAVRAQALERMNLTNPAFEVLSLAAETADKDAAAIANCELHLLLRDAKKDSSSAAVSISRLGDILSIPSPGIRTVAALLAAPIIRASGKQTEVIALMKPMAIEARSTGRKTLEFQMLTELVMAYVEADMDVEALEASQSVCALAEEMNNKVANAASLGQISILLGRLGRDEAALDAAKQAVDLAQTLASPDLKAHLQSRLAWALHRNGKSDQAEEVLSHASDSASIAGDDWLRAEMLRQRSSLLLDLERFDEAALVALEAVQFLDENFDASVRLGILSTAARALGRTDRHQETILLASQALGLARTLGQTHNVVGALARIAAAQVELGDLEIAWKTMEETLTAARSLNTPEQLARLLMVSAIVGARLGKAEAMQNIMEAIHIAGSSRKAFNSAEWAFLNPLFVGATIAGDFASLDAVIADHGSWLVENSRPLSFSREDGLAIGMKAQERGRAAGYEAISGLFPRIASFMDNVPEAKRDATWLPELISGFGEACHDTGLLRDVAKLLSDAIWPQSVESAVLLRALAAVDEAIDADKVLARLNPDTATLVRRLRGLSEPEAVSTRRRKKN